MQVRNSTNPYIDLCNVMKGFNTQKENIIIAEVLEVNLEEKPHLKIKVDELELEDEDFYIFNNFKRFLIDEFDTSIESCEVSHKHTVKNVFNPNLKPKDKLVCIYINSTIYIIDKVEKL